jgi:hypothetical protein
MIQLRGHSRLAQASAPILDRHGPPDKERQEEIQNGGGVRLVGSSPPPSLGSNSGLRTASFSRTWSGTLPASARAASSSAVGGRRRKRLLILSLIFM